MKALHANLILSFTLVLFITKSVTNANNLDSEIDFNKLRELSKSASNQPQYQVAMQKLRDQIRQTLLPNIWQKVQQDPDFKIGALSAKELFQKLNNFNLFQNNSSAILQADDDRKSDFYVLNEGWGAINTEQMHQLFNTNGGLILPLHIFLGSSGYQDDNYQLSLTLVLFDKSLNPNNQLSRLNLKKLFPQTAQELNKLVPTDMTSTKNPLNQNIKKLRTGGFTGVGGGGDCRSLQIKTELISTYLFIISDPRFGDEACFKKWSNPLAFIKDVADVEIESSTEINDVKLDYSPQGSRILIPYYDPTDQKKVESIVRSSLVTLCLIQGLK